VHYLQYRSDVRAAGRNQSGRPAAGVNPPTASAQTALKAESAREADGSAGRIGS